MYLDVSPVIPPFQRTLYSMNENTNLLLECEGVIRGNGTLLWSKVKEGSVTSYYQPNITTLMNASMICDIYSKGMPTVFAVLRDKHFEARFNRNEDLNGALVLFVKVALVFCNSMSNQSGTYQCSSDSAESTFQRLVVEVNQSSLVPIAIIVVCALLALLVTIIVIVLTSVCIKYRSIKNCPLPMWPEEPNSPLVHRPPGEMEPTNVPSPMLPFEKVEDLYEFPRDKLLLGSVLGLSAYHYNCACVIISVLRIYRRRSVRSCSSSNR